MAPISLGPGDQVLDSGTGSGESLHFKLYILSILLRLFSGAWVLSLSLAKEVPLSVSLAAIDIQSKIFPKLFPTNVFFHHHSVTDLPGEWANSYSLINQRVLYAALTESQWDSALVESHRVLAPGGWL